MKASPLPLVTFPVPQLAAVGDALIAGFRRYRARLRERAFIAQMTERDLRDIGLTRSDQIILMEKPFWRE